MICSFITSILQLLHVKQQWCNPQKKTSELAHSSDGHSIGVERLYPNTFSQFQANITTSAFAQAIQEANFSNKKKGNLVEGTVNATLSSYVAQEAFWLNNWLDAGLDSNGNLLHPPGEK